MKQINYAKQIVDMMNVIYEKNLTTVSGGNLSVKADDGAIWISPTGVDKGALTEEDIVCALPDGVFLGKNKPSIEFPFHKKIYEVSPKTKAIIHVHAPNLIATSIIRAVPPVDLLPHCAELIGRVDIAPYDIPGGYALGEKIAEVFARGNDCVIMENHGIVLGGSSMRHAFDRLEALNLIFEMSTRSKVLGKPQFCEASNCGLWRSSASKGSERANQYRKEAAELHKFVKRIYQKNLSLSNPDLFCISQRVGEEILTNPCDVPLYQLKEEDYIIVNEQHAFSHHQKVHLEIYKKNPGIHCITSAIAPNIMSFSATDTAFTTDIIPEAYVVLRNVASLEYSDYEDLEKISSTINSTTNEIIFKNNCFLCCGSSPLNMYDRVEVLEYSAKAIIDAKNVGKIVYIEGDAIKDIIRAFHLEE